jgi:hypothetical protein
VVPDPPPHGHTRSFWNFEENRVEAIAADDDQFWLGVSDPSKHRPSRSAADRVAALFQHGTTRDYTTPDYTMPDYTMPDYTMPVLTRSLIESIWVAFSPARRDRFPAAAPARLLRFLLAHRGGVAFVREGGGPNTGGHDQELDRIMREQAASQPHGYRVTRVTLRRLGDDDPDDDDPDDGDGGGVREPRRPLPNPPSVSAAVEPDEDGP